MLLVGLAVVSLASTGRERFAAFVAGADHGRGPALLLPSLGVAVGGRRDGSLAGGLPARRGAVGRRPPAAAERGQELRRGRVGQFGLPMHSSGEIRC